MLSITQSRSQNITSNFKLFEGKVQSVASQLQDMCLKVEEISIAVILGVFDDFICESKLFVQGINKTLSEIVEASPEPKEKSTIISHLIFFEREIESSKGYCERTRFKGDQIRKDFVIGKFAKFIRLATSFVKKGDRDLTKMLGKLP